MVTTARTADTDVLDIWFGSGYAFYPGSPKIKQEPVAETFAQFLRAYLTTQRVDPGMVRINEQFLRTESRGSEQAEGYDPGDVVYLPTLQSVFLLNSADRKLLTEQCPKSLQRASHLQKIKLIF